jgi:outer membrane protein assembly factor BamB
MKSMFFKSLMAGIVWVAWCNGAMAGDWPQYRGPSGSGVSTEKILTAWPAGGPKRLWTAKTPGGFSSFTVAGDKVFTVVTRNVDGAPVAMCVALDATSGKELWAAATGVAIFPGGGDSGAKDNKGGDGPRSTPTADGNRVYVYSADMVLHCLDAASGKPVWRKDITKEFSGRNISWKSALSPVIDGDHLYIAGGGAGESMLAFNKNTGALAWKAGDEKMTHATPVVATIHGVRQVIFMMQSGLVSLEAGSGKTLWTFAFPYRTATACSPVVGGDIVFCTAGYGIGGGACQITKNGAGFEAKEIWRSRGDSPLGSLWSTPVCKDGYLYGIISYKQFANGPLKCVDLKTGDVQWEQPGYGSGNVLLAGNCLLALADDGRVVSVEASPAAYKEIASFKAIEGKCWSSPALSNGRLYVRSTKEGACLDLAAKP